MRGAVLNPTEVRRAVADLAPLIHLRFASLRGRSRRGAQVAVSALVFVTLVAAVVPAFSAGAATSTGSGRILVFLPTAYFAFLVSTTLALVVGAGGRELVPREEAVAYPISPTTDHLGAFLLAPLNITWLIQSWALLGVSAYVVGPDGLLAVQITVVAWLFAATALAQLVAWCVEWVRRGAHGQVLVRSAGAALALGFVALVATQQVSEVLDHSPTLYVVIAALNGSGNLAGWFVGTAATMLAGLASVCLGALVAHAVARRPTRDESRAASRVVGPRARPTSDWAAVLRIDRASVWRSVPLRRGLLVLAVMPGAVAAAGRLEWSILPVLPGIVAAGAALLFGVNAWCLDGSGAVWRESLPFTPSLAFAVRAWVLLEILVLASTVTLLIAATRTPGPPTAAEITALTATVVVVSMQVVARSMHWSVDRPFAADLRSARAAPAPPLTMMSYSAYLALTSTLTGLAFSLMAQMRSPTAAILLTLPVGLFALRRLMITSHRWTLPAVRAEVVATVSAR
jgi:hypothetical protein